MHVHIYIYIYTYSHSISESSVVNLNVNSFAVFVFFEIIRADCRRSQNTGTAPRVSTEMPHSMLWLLVWVGVCRWVGGWMGGHDLSQAELQISFIRAQQVQECSTAALFPSVYFSPTVSCLLPHCSFTLFLSLLLSLNPSFFVALPLSLPPSLYF